MTLPSGSTVVLEFSGNDYVYHWSSAPLDTLVSTALASQPLTVLTSNLQTPSWLSTAGIQAAVTDLYQYKLTMTIKTGVDFADPSDLLNLVAGIIYQQTGLYPTTLDVASINNVSTGSPSQPAPSGGTIDLGTPINNLSNLISGLTSPTGLIVLAVVVIGLIAVVVTQPKVLKAFV